MPINNLPNDDDEALRFENEFLEAKINAQNGGIQGSGDLETPPENLNTFINNMIAFEEMMYNSKEVPLYDFIGRPEFIKEENLSDDELITELANVNQLLLSNNIICDNIHPANDRLIYKFLTEELIDQIVSDKSVPGMITHFIYEEFHPNQCM